MKRTGNLWDTLVSWENLHEAARRAALGKKRRSDVAAFVLNQEAELVALRSELKDRIYEPGPYRQFHVNDPKPRLISAAAFRDRVVHHALTQVLEPVFECCFARDSYACRTGLGTHQAVAAARRAAARFPYVLKCDVRKYFPSIDHSLLMDLLERKIKCRRTLELVGLIIAGSNPQEEVLHYFPGDTLFTPGMRRRGLPLGNQTSQFLANIYLDPLDQFVKRELKTAAYIRYVDDFLLFGGTKEELWAARKRLVERLDGLRLMLHEGKSRVYRCSEGVTFLGWRIFPNRARLVRGNVVRFRRRMREMRNSFHDGRMEWFAVQQRVRSWIGHAMQGDTVFLRSRIFDQFPFDRSAADRWCGAGVGTTIHPTSGCPTGTTTNRRTGTTTWVSGVPGK